MGSHMLSVVDQCQLLVEVSQHEDLLERDKPTMSLWGMVAGERTLQSVADSSLPHIYQFTGLCKVIFHQSSSVLHASLRERPLTSTLVVLAMTELRQSAVGLLL